MLADEPLADARGQAKPSEPQLPCLVWCSVCRDAIAHFPDDPCHVCQGCTPALAAAEDATWD